MKRGPGYGDPRCFKHATIARKCPRCGRVIYGNVYFYHRKACAKRTRKEV